MDTTGKVLISGRGMFLLISWILLGAIVGWIARRLAKNSGHAAWVDIVLGTVGGLFGGFVTEAIGFLSDYPAIIGAVIGAGLFASIGSLIARLKASPRRQETRIPSPVVRATEGAGNVIDSPASSHSGGDIFISYASRDRPTAEALAAALRKEGWSVWWDRTIPPGKSFDEVIELALNAAKCVIVLWSKASVTSDWVKVEAADAAKRRILIPAVIEDVSIPLEFRRIQAANLVDWPGPSPHSGFGSLVESVAGIVGKSGTSTAIPSSPMERPL